MSNGDMDLANMFALNYIALYFTTFIAESDQ